MSRALGKVERDGVRRIILLVLSITIHNIPEGLAVGVAFGALQNGCSAESLMGAGLWRLSGVVFGRYVVGKFIDNFFRCFGTAGDFF